MVKGGECYGKKGVHGAFFGLSMLHLLAFLLLLLLLAFFLGLLLLLMLLCFLLLRSSASMRAVTFGDVGPGSGFHRIQKLRLGILSPTVSSRALKLPLGFGFGPVLR